MRNLIALAITALAALRTTEGKTLMVANFPKQEDLKSFTDSFSASVGESDQVDLLLNPLDSNFIESKLSLGYKDVILSSHGRTYDSRQIPDIAPYSGLYESIPLTTFIKTINKNNPQEAVTIHMFSCMIGKNFDLLTNPESAYYKELNEALKNNQMLWLHGDKFYGRIYNNRIPEIIFNKNFSIAKALLDSGESLNVALKANDQLKTYQPKSFGRNGENWTIEDYRDYLVKEAKKAKKFEVENNILGEEVERVDVENLTEKELKESLGEVFVSYFNPSRA